MDQPSEGRGHELHVAVYLESDRLVSYIVATKCPHCFAIVEKTDREAHLKFCPAR